MHMTNAVELIVCLCFNNIRYAKLKGYLGNTCSNGTYSNVVDKNVTVLIRETLLYTGLLLNMLLCRLVFDSCVRPSVPKTY